MFTVKNMTYVTSFEVELKMVKIITRKCFFDVYSDISYVTSSGALQFMPWVTGQVKGSINSQNPGNFPEDSIYSSHFRDCQGGEATNNLFGSILDSFLWIRSNLYTLFISATMQVKHLICHSFECSVKIFRN